MTTLDLFIVAVGLSMDAFTVSISIGLSMWKMSYKRAAITGLFFGGFQALMPLLGYLMGTQFKDYVTSIDHWIAFILLVIIGSKMIYEARHEESDLKDNFTLRNLTVLAIATSIDALAVGVTLAFLSVNIITAVTVIGVTTFCLSIIGVKIGNVFGARFKAKAEFAGGAILVLIGMRILLDHLGVLNL
ncbi:MAG: manganese efflux pump MntP family protein [Syntrophomonas sp.]